MRVTASHIIEWVNTKSKVAQTELPRLVRRLCFNSVSTRQLAFPAGDSTFVPGWDGVLFSEHGNAWVPTGASRWEMGCDQGQTAKANKDYKKRLEQTSLGERSSSTFIFVTPRRWTSKAEWIAKQRAKGDWADVRAYDADDLEQWLEQSHSVALQFAEEIGLIGWGVESLSRFWKLWSAQCSPQITPDALFIDRSVAHEKLIEKIRAALSQPSHEHRVVVRADSAEEAVAFVVATLLETEDLADKALVVTEAEGWRFVDANDQLRIAIASRTDVAATPATRPGLLNVIPYAMGDVGELLQGEELILERPQIYEFEKALIAIGVEESDANRYALSTGRSWAIFRRQRSTNPAIRVPAWLDITQSNSLATLCLLGAWRADKEADREVVAQLAARSYEDVERDLRHLVQLDDAPVLGIGSIWKAKSPLELLGLFGSRITSEQLDRFFLIASEMLAAPDPQLELPDEERYAAQVHRKIRPHSGQLFKSICDSLVKLAVRGPEQPGLQALGIEDRVGRMVHDLLDDAAAERWLSLASHLPMLAEAAPASFLAAVEKSLRMPSLPITHLLTETGSSGIGGRCWHAGLLWSLETLAWAPNRLARVALILAELTHVEIKGNWGNKPSASLLALFRSWLPQTAASLEGRIKVLDLLILKDPEAAYDVLFSLVAPGPQYATPAARPKWRDDDAGAGRRVTPTEYHEMQTAALDKVFLVSDGNALRIAGLPKLIGPMDTEGTNKVLALMEPFTLETAEDEDREALRGALREKLHWHRNYDKTDEPELIAWLLKIETYYEGLAPQDPILRNRWLFDGSWIDLPSRDRDGDIQTRGDMLLEVRTVALNEVHDSLDMAGIEALIAGCADPSAVGATLGKMDWPTVCWAEWIASKGLEFTPGLQMTWCISALLRAATPERSTDLIKDAIAVGNQLGWNPSKCARFLVLATPDKTTWDVAKSCGSETDEAYWQNVQPKHWLREDGGELEFVLNRLIEVKRPRTALQCCQFALDRTEARLLFLLLQHFVDGEEPDGPRLDSWHLAKMFERLESASEIERMALIQLEFVLFRALGYGHEASASALYAGIMSDPTLFAEWIRILYKPEHSDREEPVTDASRNAAETAWSVLHACTRQPGTMENGSIDRATLIQFIDNTREQCRQTDRLTVCDQTLGQILAHAAADGDGSWPPALVQEVLDRPEMEQMRNGFAIGTRNKRGVTSRSPWEGGGQERDLSEYYRSQAERVQHSHINVASMLEEIAKSYDREGNREDVEANLQKESY